MTSLVTKPTAVVLFVTVPLKEPPDVVSVCPEGRHVGNGRVISSPAGSTGVEQPLN